MKITSKSAAETQKFGEEFAQKIKSGGIICLFGDLGAGKTTLVQGIARGLGVKQRIVSPTFIIARRYRIQSMQQNKIKDEGYKIKEKKKETRSKKCLWHIDLYRLNNIEEVKALGIEELWQDQSNLLLIEWPEKIVPLLPKNHSEIRLKSVGETEREISYETFY